MILTRQQQKRASLFGSGVLLMNALLFSLVAQAGLNAPTPIVEAETTLEVAGTYSDSSTLDASASLAFSAEDWPPEHPALVWRLVALRTCMIAPETLSAIVPRYITEVYRPPDLRA